VVRLRVKRPRVPAPKVQWPDDPRYPITLSFAKEFGQLTNEPVVFGSARLV